MPPASLTYLSAPEQVDESGCIVLSLPHMVLLGAAMGQAVILPFTNGLLTVWNTHSYEADAWEPTPVNIRAGTDMIQYLI